MKLSGLPFLFREIVQRNKITILLFHDINASTAEKNFTYLSNKYNIISLSDYINSNKNIPKKALIITFDDGHIGNYDMLPVIKKLNIPITIFLCSGIINTNRHYWFNHVDSNHSDFELKQYTNKKRLTIMTKASFKQEKEYEKPQALTKNQINEMKKYIDFQSHTVFHPCLNKCNDEEAKYEIYQSKEMLEKEYNLNINAIAYPNGDYCKRDIELVKNANYKCGITVDYGLNTLNSDMFKLKRLSVNDSENLDEIIVKSSSLWVYIKKMLGLKQQYGFQNDP